MRKYRNLLRTIIMQIHPLHVLFSISRSIQLYHSLMVSYYCLKQHKSEDNKDKSSDFVILLATNNSNFKMFKNIFNSVTVK